MTYGEIKAAINELKLALAEDIKEINANLAGVTPISENCFSVSMCTIMQSKNLCLSANYYNIAGQKKRIIDFIENHSVETIINFLDKLINKGLFPDGTPCNPAVVDAVSVLYKKYFD